jgi:integrase
VLRNCQANRAHKIGQRCWPSNAYVSSWHIADVRRPRILGPLIARALRAAVETGLRPGDLVRLTKGHVQATAAGRRIQTRTNKRGKLATIPVTRAMAKIIDSTPADRMLLLVNDHGEQLSEGWLSKAMKKARAAAGLRSELRLYDARGACVTRLVIAGATLSEIARHMGWGLGTAATMIETYAAMDPDLSDSVLVKLDQIRNKNVKQSVKRTNKDRDDPY